MVNESFIVGDKNPHDKIPAVAESIEFKLAEMEESQTTFINPPGE
jgi:hypothetical protein